MIYLLMFAVSLFLLWLSGKIKNGRVIKIALIVAALLLPCVMAALRGLSVGTDTSGYVYHLYNHAKNADSFSGMVSLSDTIYYSTDYAYLFINYVIVKCGLPFSVLLFIYQCLIIFPIFAAIKINSKSNKSILIGMFLFYLFFYNLSLNMVRQSIAIAFVLLSFSIFMNWQGRKKWLSSALLFVVGCLFHDTAVVSSLIFVLYLLFKSEKISNKTKNVLLISIVAVAALLVAFHRPILSFVGTSGIYPKATMYLNRFTSFDFDYLGTIRNILFIILIVIAGKKRLDKDEQRFALLVTILNFLLYFLGFFVTYVSRISYYSFFVILLLYIPIIMAKIKKSDLLFISIISFSIAQWIIVILIKNINETLPYLMAG